MEADDSTPLGADIYADRDVWQIRDSYNTVVHTKQSTQEILEALDNNRRQFEPLREKYARAVLNDGGQDKPASRERKVYFKELNRLYSATEAIKDELRQRGSHYEIVVSDEEHPNAAYKRYYKLWYPPVQPSKCYVVSAIYGLESLELMRATEVCRWRFALNPLVMPSWLLYKLLGPALAALTRHSPSMAQNIDRLIARPIVMAAGEDLIPAIPWIIYLGLWGWGIAGPIAFLLIRQLP
jgi:hypothetical protein